MERVFEASPSASLPALGGRHRCDDGGATAGVGPEGDGGGGTGRDGAERSIAGAAALGCIGCARWLRSSGGPDPAVLGEPNRRALCAR